MKNKTLFIGLLVISILFILSSCKKKEDIHVSPQQVTGTFHAFEAVMNGDTTAFPTEDESMDVTIKAMDSKHAKVLVIDYYKDNKDTLPPVICTIEKSEDGFTILNKETSSGYVSVLFYDKNNIELSSSGASQGIDIGASRNGKKPDWWE